MPVGAAEALPILDTPEHWIAWQVEQPYQYERVFGEIVMMTGGSRLHSLIKTGLLSAVHTRLRGTRRRAFDNDFLIVHETHRLYPDISVGCDETRDYSDKPVFAAEVLSPTTRRQDLGDKLAIYRAIPTLEAYLTLEQHEVRATLYGKTPDDETVLRGMDAVIELSGLGMSIPMSEVYGGLGIA